MKAIVYREYGSPDVLRYEDIEKPTAGDDQVLIEVRAASVNPFDWHFMRGTPYILRMQAGLLKPKATRLGVDVAGQVEAVGRKVTRFKPGDQVFGSCREAFAEYARTSESWLAKPSPEDLTTISNLMEAGSVTPVIDRRYRLSEVPDAIRYLETGHARGKVVITVSPMEHSR